MTGVLEVHPTVWPRGHTTVTTNHTTVQYSFLVVRAQYCISLISSITIHLYYIIFLLIISILANIATFDIINTKSFAIVFNIADGSQ